MFASAPPPTAASNPTSPSSTSARPSRLRGLNAIRNLTSLHSSSSQPSTPTGHSSSANAIARVLSNPPLATAPISGSGHGATQLDPFASYFPRRTRSSDRAGRGDELDDMVRRRGVVSLAPSSGRKHGEHAPTQTTIGPLRGAQIGTDGNTVDGQGLTGLPADQMPTIRFIPYQDPRSSKPSLAFPATSRTLPHEDCVIRVGRYSERDLNANIAPGMPSAAPVGFKSKVVSRRHCEFWCSRGQWYIKDVKSSSGTFLNHIRLSQPSVESRPFPVNDGDVVQLGIDFRGGEEQIFRCVKIRVECNRAWQQGLNSFNKTTHKRLKALGTAPRADTDNTSNYTSECSICLMSIAPCQSLFVAPCSHVWHFRCIRPILMDPKNYPQFLCPNCRAVADLEADVDEVPANWEEEGGNSSGSDVAQGDNSRRRGETHVHESTNESARDDELDRAIAASLQANLRLSGGNEATSGNQSVASADAASDRPGDSQGVMQTAQTTSPQPQSPPGTAPRLQMDLGPSITQLTSSTQEGSSPAQASNEQNEGPLTPRNEAGPFIFDGSVTGIPGLSRPANPSAGS